MHAYESIDAKTRAALQLSRESLLENLSSRARVFSTNEKMIAQFARDIADDFRSALDRGLATVAIIVPVGPVGQYERFAAEALDAGLPLERLVIILMDEYLDDRGNWIDRDDPLSFRGHLRRSLLDQLPEGSRPQCVVPDPHSPRQVNEAIENAGGVETCYAGVGVTGHLAFNDPIDGVVDPDYFASLPTRIVALSEHTRLVNSLTASRGNIQRIPRYAVTIGMKEILSARKLRIYMNRPWQCAAIRRLAFGPVTAEFPASLVQRHPDWSLCLTEEILDLPEPTLR